MIRNPQQARRRARLGYLGPALALALVQLAPGCGAAETYRSGGSTATVEQHGGSGPSRSEVTLYPDGQRIVTRDGNSTDITVQRGPGSSGAARSRDPGDERFSPPRTFPGAGLYPWNRSDASREAFRRRMLERMGPDAPR